jgi:hypothetical protein
MTFVIEVVKYFVRIVVAFVASPAIFAVAFARKQ